jgi:O-acetylserine/cysteine efflux transporter
VVTVWGLNFVAAKLGVAEVPPLLLTALRYIAAALPAVFLVRPPKVSLSLLIWYGLFVGVGQFGFLFTAAKLGMPAGLASLVVQVQGFFSIALAVVLLGERMRAAQVVGALVAFSGVAVIAIERLEAAALVPLLLTLGAAVCWAVANIITKKAGRIDMMAFVIWSSLVPPLPLLAMSALSEGPAAVPALLSISPLVIGAILFMGWAGTVFGYGAWSVLLSRYPASTIAPFALLVPVTGLAAGAVLLGERITLLEVGGCVLVFAGLLLNVFGGWALGRLRRAPGPRGSTSSP